MDSRLTSRGNLALTTTNGQPSPAAAPAATADTPAAPPRKKSTRDFWRATRFIWPYRRTILFSFFSALFVGLAMSLSLASLTPVMKVLLSKQTIRLWADSTVAEQRLGVKFMEDSPDIVVQVKPNGAAAAAGIRAGDRLRVEGVRQDEI